MVCALTPSDLVDGLTVDRRWSRQKLAAQLGARFCGRRSSNGHADGGTDDDRARERVHRR
jgi:hypothetical protein